MDPTGGPRWKARSLGRSATGWGTLQEVRDGSGTIREVRDRSGDLREVWHGSGDHQGGPGRVGGPFRRLGRVGNTPRGPGRVAGP